MKARRFRILSLVVLGSLLAVAAQAGTIPSATFDWNPRPLKLNGSKFTADTVRVSDFGQVIVSAVDPATGTSTFSEAGYLPVLGFSLGGQTVSSAGFNDPTGKGWGAYVMYQGSGTQMVTQNGILAKYSDLSYSIYGFNGHAEFGLDANGVAYTIGGTHRTLLGDGKLISGSLTLVPTGFENGVPVQFAVNGDIQTTIADVPHQFSSNTFLGFDLSIIHSSGEVFAGSRPGTIEVKDGANSTTTLIATRGNSAHIDSVALVAPVPEPASALILQPAWSRLAYCGGIGGGTLFGARMRADPGSEPGRRLSPGSCWPRCRNKGLGGDASVRRFRSPMASRQDRRRCAVPESRSQTDRDVLASCVDTPPLTPPARGGGGWREGPIGVRRRRRGRLRSRRRRGA